jgi:hypothetical protein
MYSLLILVIGALGEQFAVALMLAILLNVLAP